MAGPEYSQLELSVRVDDVNGVRTPQLVPLVNGSVLALHADIHGRGMDPDLLLGRHSPLQPPDVGQELLDGRARAPLWRGPDPEGLTLVAVRVLRENTGWGPPHDAVLWTDWWVRNPAYFDEPTTFRFDPTQYCLELIRANSDRWWEDVPRRTARHVMAVLDDRPEILGRWKCGLIGGRGYVVDGRGAVEIGILGPDGRTHVRFPCAPEADPQAAAEEILEKLTENPPDQLPAFIRSKVV